MNATSLGEVNSVRHAYRQLFELGRGGMARVYLAESLASGVRKLVVLKVLNPEYCANPEMRASFQREAELSAQINHPNVVQVYEVVEFAEAPVIVMEYLDGTPLNVLLKKAGKHLPPRLLLSLMTQVLAGLHHFHELRDLDGAPLNAVHRDVTPHNIMVLHDGPVKVLDFGIAKVNSQDNQVTRAGLIKGKLHYMPPEQLLGEAGIDRRADVFAVGVILWEALARRRMWEGTGETAMLRSIAEGQLPRLRDYAADVPEVVLQIVECATQVDRDKRFASARDMQVAIERALSQLGWLVQARELADFMSLHFGDSRRVREADIRSALRCPTGSHVVMARTHAALLPSDSLGPEELESFTTAPETVFTRVFPAARRRWGWTLAALCSICAVFYLVQRAMLPAAAPASQPATSVTLEVEVMPREAEIFLDGRLVGKGRFTGQQAMSDRKLVLELKAKGYRGERKELSIRRDTALQIVMEPMHTSREPTLTASVGASSATSLASGAPALAPAATTKRSPKRGTSSGRCNPPYTFTKDGVKAYKPECF